VTSAYYNEAKNIIYAAFDNAYFWVIDVNQMVIKTRCILPKPCLKFTAYDEKYIICACENATLLMFNTQNN
jgi:hypothetical protein